MNGNVETAAAGGNMAELLSRNWWLTALRGLAAVIFGVLAFLWPGITLLTLIYLFGVYALVNGVLAFVVAFNAPRAARRNWSLWVHGLISVVAGVIAFVLPGITALALLILIACWAIVIGVMELVAAVRLRRVITHEWLLGLAGLISVLFGVVLLVRPAAGALALIWWIGAFAIVFGVLLIALAFRMRHLGGLAPSTRTATA